MLVAFWRWWKLLQLLNKKGNERNLCQDLLTIENTDLDLKVHALHYANELLKGWLTDLFELLLRKIYSHKTSSFLVSSELFDVF